MINFGSSVCTFRVGMFGLRTFGVGTFGVRTFKCWHLGLVVHGSDVCVPLWDIRGMDIPGQFLDIRD